MSRREIERQGDSRPRVLLADTDLFFFYLKGGRYSPNAKEVVKGVTSDTVELRTSSEVYDDAITALRSDNVPVPIIQDFVSKMKSIRHTPFPMSAEIAEEALKMYQKHSGRRKLSYFDSFHAATAKRYGVPLLTSDGYMIDHANILGITVVELSSVTSSHE